LYLLYQWKKHRYPIKTIPVLFKNRIYGKSKWAYSLNSKIKTIFRTLKYIRALRTDSA
jgi:hypothetical protein